MQSSKITVESVPNADATLTEVHWFVRRTRAAFAQATHNYCKASGKQLLSIINEVIPHWYAFFARVLKEFPHHREALVLLERERFWGTDSFYGLCDRQKVCHQAKEHGFSFG